MALTIDQPITRHHLPRLSPDRPADRHVIYVNVRCRPFIAPEIIKEIIRAVSDRPAHPDCPFESALLGFPARRDIGDL